MKDCYIAGKLNLCNQSHTKSRIELAENILNYLSHNIDRKVTCAELSDYFHMSESNIRTAFKEIYGVPVWSYIRTYKIYYASDLLLNTEKSITLIAGECGYDNPSKFSAAFKKIMGVTPHDFRKHNKCN